MSDVVIAVVQKGLTFAFLERSSGTWTFPSGKVEMHEDFGAAAKREVQEETGLAVKSSIYFGTRHADGEARHYYLCDWSNGELQVTEPDKFRQARWMSPTELLDTAGDKMFGPVKAYLEHLQPKEGMDLRII